MGTKICKTCKRELSLVYFHKTNKRTGQMHTECRECRAKYAREYRQSRRDYVAEYKLKKSCEVCGFKPEHSCQLDLHHLDPETKTYKGSHKSYDAGWSLERIDKELAKCIVICKNCHALESYNAGHWKNQFTDISMRQSSAQ